MDFNPRSREGSDERNASIQKFFKDFNPRSREGSDVLYIKGIVKTVANISIHAPAKGATKMIEEAGGGISISIHAPAKGATGYLRTL